MTLGLRRTRIAPLRLVGPKRMPMGCPAEDYRTFERWWKNKLVHSTLEEHHPVPKAVVGFWEEWAICPTVWQARCQLRVVDDAILAKSNEERAQRILGKHSFEAVFARLRFLGFSPFFNADHPPAPQSA